MIVPLEGVWFIRHFSWLRIVIIKILHLLISESNILKRKWLKIITSDIELSDNRLYFSVFFYLLIFYLVFSRQSQIYIMSFITSSR